jgi:hypothetical protein
MSLGKSQAHTDAVLGLLRGSNYTTLTTIYVAIIKTMPTDDNMTGAVETGYTSYARQGITEASGWNAISGSSPRSMTNNGVINFPTPGSNDSVNGLALCRTSTVNTLGTVGSSYEVHYFGLLNGGTQSINNGVPVSLAAGALTVSED